MVGMYIYIIYLCIKWTKDVLLHQIVRVNCLTTICSDDAKPRCLANLFEGLDFDPRLAV